QPHLDRHAEPVPQRWSPLSAADMEHIYEEANRLARQLHKVALKEAVGEVHFVAPFRRAEAAARSSRRETYVVRDSPVRLLLPDIRAPGFVTSSHKSVLTPNVIFWQREQDGSRLQASRSGAPLLSYTGRAPPAGERCLHTFLCR
uniref:Uncharacterized protein n=1 Tax=Scleropages formosus TaxID=113540 RepID=A0A8C9VR22_SCLFO